MALSVVAETCSRCVFYHSIFVRSLSTSTAHQARLKKGLLWKKRNKPAGLSPLGQLPDWSHTDGRPAPPGHKANLRKEIQRQICQRIIELNADIARVDKIIERRDRQFRRGMQRRTEARFIPKGDADTRPLSDTS